MSLEMNIQELKKQLRKEVAQHKKQYSAQALAAFSFSAVNILQSINDFESAQTVCLYHSLPDEINTHGIIEKFYKQKNIILPVVVGDNLLLKPYKGIEHTTSGPFGIIEPALYIEPISPETIDLIVIPGMAFDRNGNRLGRGRGFYDRLLKTVKAPRIGICFDFQLVGNVPTEPFDVRMNKIVTNTEVVDVR